MPYKEVSDEEIVAAIEEWAEWHPFPDKICMFFGSLECSPRDVARILRKRLNSEKCDKTEEELFVMLNFLRETAKADDDDLLARLRLPIKASKKINHG